MGKGPKPGGEAKRHEKGECKKKRGGEKEEEKMKKKRRNLHFYLKL